MSEKVIVTGASGHIGFHVAGYLCEQGYRVHIIVRSLNANTESLRVRGAVVHSADLFDPNSYREFLQNASALFHLAGENTIETSDEDRVIGNTLSLTENVLHTAIDANIPTIIYTSSVVVLGRSSDPSILVNENNRTQFAESPYVKGKLLTEEFCESLIKKGKDIRIVYPSWVVGSHVVRPTPPHSFIRQAMERRLWYYFNGGISIANVHDVAKGHIAVWKKGTPQGKYILGGINITFVELFSRLAAVSHRSKPIVKIPKSFIVLAAQCAKMILGKNSPIDPQYVRSVVGRYSWYDSSKAQNELKYNISPLDNTLREGISEIAIHRAGISNIFPKHNDPTIKRLHYSQTDILLITGFPGWLANRMVEVFMNGDRNGDYAVDRKVRMLVQSRYKDLRFNLPQNFEIVYGDLEEQESLSNALKNVSAVYHCAAVVYPSKIKTLYDVNWLGTKNLVDACIAGGIRRIIYMGTDSICGFGGKERIFDEHTAPSPYRNYGKSKFLAEQYILQKTKENIIDGTSLRGFWFFGPHMPARNQNPIRMLKWTRQIILGTGRNYRSLTHIDNVIQAFVKCEKNAETIGKWYWISDRNYRTTIDEIFQSMAVKLHAQYTPLYLPNIVSSFFSMVDLFLGIFGILNPTIHAAGKFSKDIAGDHSAAKRDFGYDPIDTFVNFNDDVNDFYSS